MADIIRKTWDDNLGRKLLLAAMCLLLLTHGVIIYYTLPKTYDAFIHIFFADHYARFWFEPWEYRWYTGFLTTSYPPLVHQSIALISKIFPLKVAFSIYAIVVLEVLIIGIYRFSKLFFDKTTAGISAILAVLLTSITETLHVFGQIPTLTGLAFLLNALPFLYQYLIKKKPVYLFMALSFMAVVICSHHVTVIFGMFFFIVPTIFMAIVDGLPETMETKNNLSFILTVLREAIRKYRELFLFGILLILMIIVLIFPYWYWSKTDPITQVSIPHGSRDNFFINSSAGIIFYIIPLALILALLPAVVYGIAKHKRFIGWAFSFFLCLLLGSGGTTPLPRLMLGDTVFNILTLDRFGFWASIIAIPFMAKFIFSFLAGPVRDVFTKRFGTSNHFILSGITGFSYLLFIIYIFHLASFRPLQPKEIDTEPLLNFLNRDDHMRWRYLTLGFGDQMAWLSANSLAATVDGNYHSARRLPELTKRPVERIENAKYSGNAGLASLNDFLCNAEKYSLKYVFSNDRYYDPLLYYSGWNRAIRLENGIMVWEKGNISTIKPVKAKEMSPFLKKSWGIIPLSCLTLAIFLTVFYLFRVKEKEYLQTEPNTDYNYPEKVIYTSAFLPFLFFSGFMLKQVFEIILVKEQKDPQTTVLNYYSALDFQRFEKAFHFYKPTPAYTIDQYLLEKSVNDGGLLPSYAKLDSLSATEISRNKDTSLVKVFTRWRTSLGYREKTDSLRLIERNKKWYILPPLFIPEVPDEQMRSYTYTLFRRMGKRVISSFPTVKDDRVKKPFAAFLQANLIRNGNKNFITGEILNSDDIPVNLALKVTVRFENRTSKDYYPEQAFQYNLSPKASGFFQISLDNSEILDSIKILSVELYAETDVSDRGYIHGASPGYSVRKLNENEVMIETRMYNELTTEINIPGILIAEKDIKGNIWQAQLAVDISSLRSGLHSGFSTRLTKIQSSAAMITEIPVTLFINGQKREKLPLQKDEIANKNSGIALLPHCYISQEIILQ